MNRAALSHIEAALGMEQAWWDRASLSRGEQISQGCAEVSQPGGRGEQDHPNGKEMEAALLSTVLLFWMPSSLLSSWGWFLD